MNVIEKENQFGTYYELSDEDRNVIIPSVGSEEVIEIRLTPEKYPIAFKNKVDELCEQGAFNTRAEAEEWVKSTPFVMELIYEKHSGLFAVESDALENTNCFSPYTTRDLVTKD